MMPICALSGLKALRFWCWLILCAEMSSEVISKTEVSAYYRHVSLKILEKFPEVMERVSFEVGQQKNQFRISMQTPVENPLMTIESFSRQFQIGERERELVKFVWEQESGKTMFHVVNAYTRAAQFEDCRRRRATDSRRWEEWCWEW